MAKFGELEMAWISCFNLLPEHENLKRNVNRFWNYDALTKSVVNFQVM
jgi:hypothetical protein